MTLSHVAFISAILSVLSFVAFIVFAALSFRKLHASKPSIVDLQLQSGISEITQLIQAIAKLAESLGKFAESLAKAGPAIAALISSLIFMAIALAASK